MDEEQALLEAYRLNGSDEAFAALVHWHIDLVYSAARRQVIDPGLAEDVTQAVFIVLHRKARSLRGGVVISAWLLTTTHLCARDALKRRARRDKHERRAAQMTDLSRSASISDWDQICGDLDQAMAHLPRADRELLVLRFWDQKSHREIAEAIGISENAVTKRTMRALEKLKGVLLRSGAVVSAETLPSLLSSHVIETAPAHLSGAAIAATHAASASSAAIAKGATYVMTLSKLKIAAASIAGLVLVATVALPLVQEAKSQSSPTSVASAPPVAPATIQSVNAADTYRAALQLMGNIEADPNISQLSRPYDGVLNASTGAFVGRYTKVTELVRLAASLHDCDWGEQAMQERLDEQSKVAAMFKLVVLEARYELQQENQQRFIDDMLAAITLIRQRARKGMITDKLIEVGSEGRAIDVLAAHLTELSPDLVRQLPQRLEALPKPETGQEMIAAEYAYAQTQKQENITMAVMVNSMDQFYKTIGAAMDTQPPSQFSATVDQEIAKNAANPFVKILAPSLKRIRENIAVADTRRAMLRAAVDVLIQGDSAIAKSQDPFGAGPFGYVKTAKGFELNSQLSDRSSPVKLTVGE